MRKFKYILLTAALCTLTLTACSKSAKELNNEGIEFYNAGDYESAKTAFSDAIAMEEDNEEYYMNLGMTYLELEDYAAAEEAFNVVVEAQPENLDAYRNLGMVHYYSGEYAQAITDFKALMEHAGENYNDTVFEALQYYASLQTYYSDYAGAIDSYTILIDNNYNVGQQYFLRGSIYTSQGMENEAVFDYEEALKELGNDYEIYYNIYHNFNKVGFTDRADSYLKRALEVSGANNLLKGKTYYIIEDYDNAKSYLSKAVDEGEAEAEYLLGMTYEKLGKYEEAEEMYASYIKKCPNDPCVYNQYGMYFMNKGEYESALEYFKKGIDLGSDVGKRELLFNEACCYEYLEMYSLAFTKFQEYLKLYPDDAAAQHEFNFLSTR